MPLFLPAAQLLASIRCAIHRGRRPAAEPLPQIFHHLSQLLLLLLVLLLRCRLSLARFLDVMIQDLLLVLLRIWGRLRGVLRRQSLNVILRLNQEMAPASTLDLAALELVIRDFFGWTATDPTRDR